MGGATVSAAGAEPSDPSFGDAAPRTGTHFEASGGAGPSSQPATSMAGGATTTESPSMPELEPEPEVPPVVAFSPNGGAFTQPIDVTLTPMPGTRAFYTTDGSVPTESSTPYSSAISVEHTTTLSVLILGSGVQEPVVDARTFVQVDDALAQYTSDLPIVLIHSQLPRPDEKIPEYDPATLNTFHPDPATGRATPFGSATLSTRIGIKVRGSSSQHFEKRPYAVEIWDVGLDDDVEKPFLGMPKESDWVFSPPFEFDRALMRNAFTYALSNFVGRYAPRTAFAEVFFAQEGSIATLDDYRGVYTIAEKPKRDGNRIDVDVLEPGMTTLPEVAGGYVFKVDRLDEGESGFVAGTAADAFDVKNPLAHVYPKEEELAPEQKAFLIQTVDEFADALANDGFAHPESGVSYADMIDVDAWIDHHIINVLTKNPDALRLSTFLHMHRGGPIVAGPVWDFDRSMGCAMDRRASDPTWWSDRQSDGTDYFAYGWWRRLFEDPQFVGAYWARWDELLGSTLSVESMHGIIDGFASELAESAVRNFERWPETEPRDGSFEGEVGILKQWLAARHAWIRSCLELDDPLECTGTEE